jgi:hypothetical protein
MGQEFFNPMILAPGWAGDLSPEELAYIKRTLKRNPELRRLWGFRTTRISDDAIRKVAMDSAGLGRKSAKAHQGGSEMKLEQKGKGET